MPSLEEELFPSTPGKFKIDRAHNMNRQFNRCFASTSTMFLWALFLIALTASYLSFQSFVDSGSRYFTASWGGIQWEKQIRNSAQIHRSKGMSVLVTGAAGFVGSHVSLALKKRGDGVVGIDNFNNYYDPSLKKARKSLLNNQGIFIVEGDINDARLIAKLFDIVAFTHVMHLAAQAGVRYAMENPHSYVHSNIAGLVTLLEACKLANPQPSVVWASSSSVYGLNEKVPFSESDRTDQPASLYAATKKAGEEITHTYNHIYGLSVTGLRFFTVYGPFGRPDMAYFSFTRNILQGKPITIYRGKNRVDLARDFTYIDEHNHDNIDPNNAESQLLWREIHVDQAAEGDLRSNSGTESSSTFELVNRQFEVWKSLDQLAMDFDNSLRSERIRDMKEGEAGRLLRYFQRQHIENPSFIHSIQVDIDDKVSNIFWADDKMVVDFDHFGDVVCLDTSYRMNKDLQPFVQFIGVNHHNQAIIFAAALLFDDTVESLKWLFNTFLEAMSGKKPKVILTDQDAAIVEAINSILPETSHRICVWQMYQNALKHLSLAVKDMESFSNDFRSCIYDYNNEEAFVHAWEGLLDKYGLQQNDRLRWMFREREKWSIAYGRNTFFLDMKGSHVAEDLSNNLRSYLNSDQDALQIYKIFERVADEQRFKETHANDEMTRSMPRLLGNVALLKHASGIYTPKAFELFQKEYEKCLNVVVTQCNEKGFLLEYKVSTFGQTQEYTVIFNSADDTVVCNCMKFENVGFLCGHALKVLDNWNIKVVPSRYILKRWTKDTRLGRVRDSGEFTAKENLKLAVASRYKDLCRNIIKISARAAESEDAFQFALRQLDELIEGVEKILMLKAEEGQGITSSSTVVNGFESENAEFFLDEEEIEDQGEDNRVDGTKERESAAPDRHQLKNINEKSCKKKRFQLGQTPSPNTSSCISSPPQARVMTEGQSHNPLLQGLYNFEANQVVQCMYQQQNPVMDHEDNPNMYQQSVFYADQHVSPTQIPLLQEPLIRSAYQESLTNNALLRQAIDLDLQHPHSSSILLYDHGFRTFDTSYLGLK